METLPPARLGPRRVVGGPTPTGMTLPAQPPTRRRAKPASPSPTAATPSTAAGSGTGTGMNSTTRVVPVWVTSGASANEKLTGITAKFAAVAFDDPYVATVIV